MSDPFSSNPAGSEPRGLNTFQQDVREAQEVMDAFCTTFERKVTTVFSQVEKAIGGALKRAARDGEISFNELAVAVIESLSRIGYEKYIAKPLGDIFGQVARSSFLGARAGGGPVTGGGAYLVGEQGPEMFVPHGAGEIRPQNGGGLVVHVHLPPGTDAGSFQRSEQQIAASLARAVMLGQRSL